MVQKLKFHSLKILHQRWSKSVVPTGHKEKNFSFHFKRYNLTIRAVNFFETFCTCSPSSLGQDLMVKIAKRIYFFVWALKLEMADFSCFFDKNDLP
jgi:hypothetical protein